MVDLAHDAMRLSSRPEAREPASGIAAPEVAILLSTFNGERYLADQLRSFTAQVHENWRLYWRDDGSVDRSPAIMDAFGEGPGKGRCDHLAENGNLHATGSFLSLLRRALRDEAEFFAFSDQDDVWLPDKLAHAVAALTDVVPGRPAIYFCARTPVDSGLRPIGRSPLLRRPPGFPAALTQNVIPGCCMTLNREDAELIVAAEAPDRTWHDWWCYLVVSARDGLVMVGDSPDILYRQHGQNLVGEPRRFWDRGAAAVRRGRDPFLDLFRRHVAALHD